MAQEYSIRIDATGTYEQRRSFIADTLQLKSWGWKGMDITSEAPSGGDAGKTRLDFYSRGFPREFNRLMAAHPEVTLDCIFVDLSSPQAHPMKLKNNFVLEESIDNDPFGELANDNDEEGRDELPDRPAVEDVIVVD